MVWNETLEYSDLQKTVTATQPAYENQISHWSGEKYDSGLSLCEADFFFFSQEHSIYSLVCVTYLILSRG